MIHAAFAQLDHWIITFGHAWCDNAAGAARPRRASQAAGKRIQALAAPTAHSATPSRSCSAVKPCSVNKRTASPDMRQNGPRQ